MEPVDVRLAPESYYHAHESESVTNIVSVRLIERERVVLYGVTVFVFGPHVHPSNL